MKKKNNKPVHEIRLGTVKATIWRDKVGEIARHNVTFSRLYKDGDQWKSSDSFGRNDLPKLAILAQKAYVWVFGAAAK